MSRSRWSLPFGAETTGEATRFVVWSTTASTVEVEIEDASGVRYQFMSPGEEAVFSTTMRNCGDGARYKYRLDGQHSYPDPYSRAQPDGPHGHSLVVDPTKFAWHDDDWRGIDPDDLIIYETHVGTYTAEGTFEALMAELPGLRRLGVTAIELMPIAEFAGRWNWGYDGVDLFAPASVYGGPHGLKCLIDAAHQLGLGVILDVVYNHLGPSGNYLRAYAPQYFTERHHTPWGAALNYDGPDSHRMRQMVVENACYWISEYHVDGLRLDATHAISDESPCHITQELSQAVRHSVSSRQVVVIAEDSSNDVAFIRPPKLGGRGLDGVWADDFHHATHVLLTGERDGYYADYQGSLEEVGQTIREGFLYQGQVSPFLGRRRGTKVTYEPARSFVFCLQNHDQIGNRAFGARLCHLAGESKSLVAAALLLLAPETPLLFMGEEFAASTPFLYFTDHESALGKMVTDGRRQEFARFAAFADPDSRQRIPDPQDERTFLASKLDLAEREKHAAIYRCYRELIALRRSDPVLRVPDRINLSVAVPTGNVIALQRWTTGDGDDTPVTRRGERRSPAFLPTDLPDARQRLVIANFGPEVELQLVPAEGSESPDRCWQLIWHGSPYLEPPSATNVQVVAEPASHSAVQLSLNCAFRPATIHMRAESAAVFGFGEL